MKKFIIFDRDGTLINKVHYLTSREQVNFPEGLGATFLALKNLGFCFGIITNQSVIGRGLATRDDVNDVHRFIADVVYSSSGCLFDFVLFCPHISQDECNCRKPRTGFIEQLVRENILCIEGSYMVGDSISDVEFGNRAGLRTVLIAQELNLQDLSHEPDGIIEEFHHLPNMITQIEARYC